MSADYPTLTIWWCGNGESLMVGDGSWATCEDYHPETLTLRQIVALRRMGLANYRDVADAAERAVGLPVVADDDWGAPRR